MTWYVALTALLLLLGLIEREFAYYGKDVSKGVLLGACGLLFLFSALRATSVGADTSNYETLFDWVSVIDFSELNNISTTVWFIQGSDYAYRVYAKILTLVFNSNRSITVFNSLIVICALYLFIRGQSSDTWLSCFLFLTLGMFQLSMNLAPFFMAILIVYAGFHYAREQDLKRFILFVLIGSIFHPTAIVMLLVYPLIKLELTNKRLIIILILAALVALFFYPAVLNMLQHIVPSRYIGYFTRETLSLDKMFVWFTHLVLFVTCWLFQEDRFTMIENHSDVCWLFLLESIAYLFLSQSSGLNRVAFMFAPSMLVIVPELLETAKKVQHSRFSSKKLDNLSGTLVKMRVETDYVRMLIVAECIAMYLCRLFFNNIGNTMPYLFFWVS